MLGMKPDQASRLMTLCALLLAAVSAFAADKVPLRVLFVGNSLTYTNDLPAMVGRIAVEDGRAIKIEMLAEPNYSLGDHLAEPRLASVLRRGKWDFIVLQQGPSSLSESRAQLISDTKEIAAMAGPRPRLALLAVWPPNRDSARWARVTEAYRLATEAVGGVLIPCGTAFWDVLQRDESAPLLLEDRFHPAAEGTFLMALVVYRVLVGQLPATSTSVAASRRIAGVPLRLNDATRAMLLQVAEGAAPH